jgi:hypothetical protein
MNLEVEANDLDQFKWFWRLKPTGMTVNLNSNLNGSGDRCCKFKS